MARTLKDLLLALLNATLILVALCLFLGWKLASTVDGIASSFAQNIQIVAPLKDEIQGVRGELAALRSDLSAIQLGDVVTNRVEVQKLSSALDKLDGLEVKLQSAQTRVSEITDAPDELINTAIQTSADAIADRIIAIRGCEPAT